MTQMPLEECTSEQSAQLARIERAEPAPESLRERVAVAIMDADYMQATGGLMDWLDLSEDEQNDFRHLADAALAVIRGEQ